MLLLGLDFTNLTLMPLPTRV